MARRTRDQNRRADGRYAPDSSGKAGITAPAAAPNAWQRMQRRARGWCETHAEYHTATPSGPRCASCLLREIEAADWLLQETGDGLDTLRGTAHDR